jgi:hypothetical protein
MGRYDGQRALIQMTEVEFLYNDGLYLKLQLVTTNSSPTMQTREELKIGFSHMNIVYIKYLFCSKSRPETVCGGLNILEECRTAKLLSLITREFHSSNWCSNESIVIYMALRNIFMALWVLSKMY